MVPLTPSLPAWTPTGTTSGQDLVFEDFFEAERDRLLKTFTVITGSRAEAEDIVQDAFLGIWQRWDRVSTLEDPRAYLNRAAVNGFRTRSRRAMTALRKATRSAAEPDRLEAVDDRDEVHRALASLTPRQRAALVLTELWDLTAEEAGRLLGIRAATVRALAFQGRTALRAAREASDV